jgi:glycogen operon protein
MLLAGDEFARTQQGNNNAYCQDSAISWLDWDITQEGREFISFTQKLTSLRHKYPILRRTRFLTGEYNEELGVKDVTWINANGEEMQAGDWDDPGMKCFGMLMDGRAQVTGLRKRGQDATLLLVINGYHDGVKLPYPQHPRKGMECWLTLVLRISRRRWVCFNEAYQVTARSLLLLLLQPDLG